jgi:hypothetical protein
VKVACEQHSPLLQRHVGRPLYNNVELAAGNTRGCAASISLALALFNSRVHFLQADLWFDQ